MKKRSTNILLFAICIIFSVTLYGQSFDPNKWYRITSNHFGGMRSLALTESNGVKIITMEATSNHRSQYWRITDRGKMNYRLINMESGNELCIEVEKKFQSYLQMTNINEDASQFWKIFDRGNGLYQMNNTGNGSSRSLDISDDSNIPVKRAVLSNTDPQRNGQYWQIVEITATPQYEKQEIKGPEGFSKGPNEGGGLFFNFKADVAYGANGSFIYKYGVTGIINFTTDFFGADPAPGFVKSGFYKQVTEVIPPAPPINEQPVVNKPANENVVNNQPVQNNALNVPLPKPNEYVRITNKVLGDQFDLDYNVESGSFLVQSIIHGWKLEPVLNSSADQFKILVNINGKYWALTTDQTAVPKLAEPSSADGYQYWNIERLADDGYYKITNSVLRYNGSTNTNLFCDQNNKTLFMTGWDEARSLNGRWLLNSYGAITNEVVDEFDNKSLELLSAVIKKPMCYGSYLVGDLFESAIVPCSDKTDKFIFKKAINGEYLIATVRNENSRNVLLYLNWNLQFEEMTIDPAATTQNGMTWKIDKVSNLYYKISNGSRYMEFIQGSQPLMQMRSVVNNIEQLWYFR